MKLNQLLAQIISAPNFDRFSAVELRSAYIAMHSDKNIDPSTSRRFVYAELVKLVKQGWLRKSISKKKEITTFIKTDLFNVNKIIYESSAVESNSKANTQANAIRKSLLARLNKYKNELLINYGESSEYKQLCNEFPDLHERLQPQYNNAREQSSRLLGQIKAVENLIKSGKE
jgi:hypothetical protein